MRKLFYMGLESYPSRYTYQLTDWNERVFKRRGIDYHIVPGEDLSDVNAIVTGQVLDAHGRSYYSLTQMANLVKLMKAGEVTGEDAIFFEDMYTAGIESLPYIMDQIPEGDRPNVWVRCLAQSIDPDDFVHVWNMDRWMRHYESLVNEFVTGVLASNEEMVANMKIAGWKAPIYNIAGLAFNKQEVQSRVPVLNTFDERAKRVVFAARWDQEKQPSFFLDLAESHYKRGTGVEFAILQGGPLRSNHAPLVEAARNFEKAGKISIYENLSKNQYYELVNDSRVLFNCALQDWTSNTVSEADALGCNVLFPAYRSFPEIFANDHQRMFVPWSRPDAEAKLDQLLKEPHPNMGMISDWTDKAIDRTLDIMQGRGGQWNRDSKRYRNNILVSNY